MSKWVRASVCPRASSCVRPTLPNLVVGPTMNTFLDMRVLLFIAPFASFHGFCIFSVTNDKENPKAGSI